MNKADKEILVYIAVAILLVFVGFKFVKPEFNKYQRTQQKVSQLEPVIKKLENQVKINQEKLKTIKEAEEPKVEKSIKKVFTIAKISDAQDNTSIILDEIFMIAKKHNIQLLEIDHSANNKKEEEDFSENQTTKQVKKTIKKINEEAEKLAADLTQKEVEYYQIEFLFSSTYASMKAFLTELLKSEYYIKIDSVKSEIQKGRRNIINTDLKLSILLKRK